MAFLSGHCSHIILLNYGIDPTLLSPHLPPSIEADLFNGRGYLSLVGLQFHDLRAGGLPLPFYRHYAQVNLRGYVRRRLGNGTWRHGVVFIRQIVPHRLIAWAARRLFHETVVAHRIDCVTAMDGQGGDAVEYGWHCRDQRHSIKALLRPQPRWAVPSAEQDFFVNRHWGYSAQQSKGGLEYRFDHPPWQAFQSPAAETAASVGDFYGSPFDDILKRPPDSAFASNGSMIALHHGQRAEPRIASAHSLLMHINA